MGWKGGTVQEVRDCAERREEREMKREEGQAEQMEREGWKLGVKGEGITVREGTGGHLGRWCLGAGLGWRGCSRRRHATGPLLVGPRGNVQPGGARPMATDLYACFQIFAFKSLIFAFKSRSVDIPTFDDPVPQCEGGHDQTSELKGEAGEEILAGRVEGREGERLCVCIFIWRDAGHREPKHDRATKLGKAKIPSNNTALVEEWRLQPSRPRRRLPACAMPTHPPRPAPPASP